MDISLIRNMRLLILFFLVPFFLNSQSEGGFGYRRFSNTTTLNNVAVSNIQPSHSRNAYVHSNGLYYVWDGDSWEREHDIDTLSLSGNILSVSLYGDGVPAKTVDLSTNIYCDAIVSPPSFSTNQDNYNPTGLSSACELRLATTAQVNVTGIVAQSDGFELILTNEGNYPITLSNDVTSTAANRFLFGYNYNLAPNKSVRIRYDGTASRWRINDSGSLGTGSGRIAGGRSQNVYWSYQTDTLNHFAIGYGFDLTSTDEKSDYNKFGFVIHGDGGFQIRGKETYIKGASFDSLKTSRIAARESNYDLTSYSRTSVGGSSNISALYGFPTENVFYLQHVNVPYYNIGITTKKDWTGTPSNKKDYGSLYQGGDDDNAVGDTSLLSVWWGLPQITDTSSSANLYNGISAKSKERGFGVQSLWDSGGNEFSITKYDWFKIKTGNVVADTSTHSSSNDGITFYGNSYELPNQVPSSAAGDTSLMLWTDRYNSFFLDIDDIRDGAPNLYNSNDTTTNVLRTAFVLRSLWFRGIDSTGFIRWGVRPDNFNGTQFSVYQDSLVADTDTIQWNSSWNPTLQYHGLNAESTYFYADSAKSVSIGQFPDFPDVNYFGYEKGFIYSPEYLGSVSLHNGDGLTGDYVYLSLQSNSVDISSTDQISTGFSTGQLRIQSQQRANSLQLTSVGLTSELGGAYFKQHFNDTLAYQAIGFLDDNDDPSVFLVMGKGGQGSTSVFDKSNKKKFAIESYKFDLKPYLWLEVEFPTSTIDTTSDRIKFYNGSYAWENDRPSNTVGDTSIHVWIGDGSGITTPAFMLLSDIVSSSVNIFNSNGTQDDADRLFTVDSSQTLAIGQFSSVSTPTWGRGFYYDPSTANGVRVLNKANDNSSSTKVELDATTLSIGSTHTTSSSSVIHYSINESASFESIVNRTSDTYGSLDIVSFTNSNEEIIALKQTGKGTAQAVSMYLGDGYSSSQYARYANRAWGVETLLSSGGYDWIQVLLPDTGTDTTGNNINFYNRAYYWVNDAPSSTVGDTMVHAWVGNGTNSTPLFLDYSTIGNNIYNSNGTTTDNTRTANITESIRWVGSADLGVDPYPFQIHSTGNEPLIQAWYGNQDSAYIYQSDVEYIFGSSTRLVVDAESDLTLIGDSIAVQGVEDKTTIRKIIGVTPGGYLKTFDGDASSNGDVLMSNGTDWVVTSAASFLSAGNAYVQSGNSFGASAVLGTNDNNSLSFEVNNVTGLTLNTDYSLTATANVSSTNTSADRIVIRTNSTGTPTVGHGGSILFQGESTTTDNRDMAYIKAVWQTAVDATRRSNLSFGTVQNGVFTEGMKLNANFLQPTSGGSLTIGGSSDAVYLGNSSGLTAVISTGTGSVQQIAINASGNNTNTSGSIGYNNFSTTSGTKYDWRMTGGFAPTSGVGNFYNLLFNGEINQTGGANGNSGAIIFNPTLTSLGGTWSALTMATSNSSTKFLNQTGSNTTSTHVGAFGFGSTTVPTDKVEITGNLALLTAGNKLKIATGSNASVGTSAAMTAGSITINTTAVTANSQIFLTHATLGGTQGILSVGTVTAGTSFVINSSSATDTGTVHWLIIN